MTLHVRNAGTSAPPITVEAERLGKSFGSGKSRVRVLDGVSLEVAEGEMLVLLGPSGCGKTTLLRCLVGLEQADEGKVRLDGKLVVDAEAGLFVPPERRGVGMVFQNYALWPHMTVAKNVEYPLKARGLGAAIAEGRVQQVLDIVQCGHLAHRYPPQLSGGQQQRVSLARALASRPSVMLLDEPLSNLDALLRVDLRAQLRLLHRQLGFTGIYVTHDQVEAMSLATRIVVMRAGRIEQIGRPLEIHGRPANEYVAEFLGMRNRIACRVEEAGHIVIAGASGILPSGAAPGSYRLRARPSGLRLRPAGSGKGQEDGIWATGGRIVERLMNGETTDYIVSLGGDTLFVEARGGAQLREEQPVDVGVEVGELLLYDEEGVLAPFSPGGRH